MALPFGAIICVQCHDVLESPVKLDICGHHCCFKCKVPWTSALSNDNQCSKCKKPFSNFLPVDQAVNDRLLKHKRFMVYIPSMTEPPRLPEYDRNNGASCSKIDTKELDSHQLNDINNLIILTDSDIYRKALQWVKKLPQTPEEMFSKYRGIFRGMQYVESLGSGRHGCVYKVFDPLLQKYYAIKLGIPDLTNIDDMRRMNFELFAHSKEFRHPNIVGYHKFNVDILKDLPVHISLDLIYSEGNKWLLGVIPEELSAYKLNDELKFIILGNTVVHGYLMNVYDGIKV